MTIPSAQTNDDATQLPAPRRPRLVPANADTLNVWRYMEYSILRIIAGWGRQACDWEDKLAVCYHVWLQAEIVDRLRKRLEMFPPHKPELPVAGEYETLSNAVLLAPDFPTAMRGIHEFLNPALTEAYRSYLATSHPVHDKPTHDLLREVLEFKEQQAAWYAGFASRNAVAADANESYTQGVGEQIARLDRFVSAVPVTGEAANPAGIHVDFRMPQTPGRVPHWDASPNIMPLLELDWSASVEARRLYFMIGYFWEMGVAENQLRWIYHADFMPWEFIYEESRHMWDESRHGNSGLSRLRDFGLDIADIGYSSYGAKGGGFLSPMTPRDVYDGFYQVTQVAERGYFKTKTYCFEDFAAGNDPASAEMMQYDIIDETMHAEYGRKWLSEMAARAGVEEDWLARGAKERGTVQQKSDARVESYRNYLRNPASVTDAPANLQTLTNPAARRHYEKLLAILRDRCPLTNADTAPNRPNLPM